MSTTAENGQTTTYTYDSMLRPLTATYPDSGVTTWTYSMAGTYPTTNPTTSVSVLHAGSSAITQTSTLDWYGRTLTTSLTDSSGNDLVTYAYDANNNVSSVTNPYRSGGTLYYTTYAYDALGRKTTINKQDCSTTCSKVTFSNSGNTQTRTDEVGNQRETFVDGLGRLTKVLEPNSGGTLSLETDYLYNQNYSSGSGSTPSTYQTIVNQKGGSTSSSQWRTRTFTNDLFGRVQSETTPEAGTTSYVYSQGTSFCAGDVTQPCQRTDARGAVTTYAYDALNRLTSRSYTTTGTTASATATVTNYYDQTSYNGLTISNGHGQRTGMSDGSGATAWSYDAMGRPTAIRKTLNSVTEQSNYTYNLDGTVNTLQDFGGTTLTYAYDSTGRQTGVSDGSGNSYASSATYNAASQLTGLTHQLTSSGATYSRTLSYTSRLLPYTISATLNGTTSIQSLTYGYPAAGSNNGSISSIANGLDSTRSQSFSYDNLNRLIQAQDGSHWGEQYSFDNWGNMYNRDRLTGLNGDSWSVTVNGNNQLSNLSYDAAGNVTTDQFSNSFTYDAEGRITTGGSGTYVYDGDGYRVEKTASSTTTLYWPSAVAGVLDESNSGATSFGKQVYVAGLQVWSEDISGTGKFLFQDHLGSTRVTADAAGNRKDDIDYLPWGEQYANYGFSPSDNHYLFTGYESDDSQSSTEYATFRNLSGSMARFQRPDPYDGSYDQTNPQTLNRYTYGLNNPVIYTDPSGLDVTVTTPDGGSYTYTDDQWAQLMAGGYGTGISVDNNGNIICADGSTCGTVTWSPGATFSTYTTVPQPGNQVGGTSAPSNPAPTPKPPMTPEQQKKAVCDQAASVTRNLSGVRTAGVVIAAAGAVCIGATGGGCAPVGGIAVAVGATGTLVFGSAELLNSAIANWGLGCKISW